MAGGNIWRVASSRLLLLCLALALGGCASYYRRNLQFNQAFQAGNLEEANKWLDKTKKAETGKNRLLYWLNKGTLLSLDQRYEESNAFFEKAYIYTEDYSKDAKREAFALLTNPEAVEYPGEEHEVLLIHYYKALNYLKLNNLDAALVECRRMTNKLNRLSDRFTSKRKYKRDAFIENLVGIIYDAQGDYNNAFIAYRNALQVYEEDFQPMFGLAAPQQLKQDLLRAAYLTGFSDQVAFYEKKFGLKYNHQPADAQVLMLWHNGLGPVKGETSINFTVVPGGVGVVTFVNEDYGLNFAMPVGDQNEKAKLSQLSLVRMALPKYLERPELYKKAELKVAGATYALQQAYNVDAVAQKVLQDRLLTDMGKAVLRLALKKASELSLRKQNELAGAALSVLNAVTEKADTRNWGSLPHSIYYTRVPLPAGQHTLSFSTDAGPYGRPSSKQYSLKLAKGETSFLTYHSLDFLQAASAVSGY